MAAYAALVSLMHIIDQIQLHPRPPIFLQQNQIELLTTKATFLQEFLEDYNSNVDYSAEADPLESRIADAAYAAEDLIESHIFDNITNHEKTMSSSGLYGALEKVMEEMDCIRKEAVDMKEAMGVQRQLHRISMAPTSMRSSSVVQMVGVDDLLLQMMEKLTGGQDDLQTIPIVGMGGIGKTALASNIFQKPPIKEYFYISAWATISQEYSMREILEEVLCQLHKYQDRQNLSEEDLGERLYKHLYGRRYMIILDDVWSKEAWDEVRRFFPDNKNGSRIVITTRLSNLASVLTESNRLEMRLLDEANSWDLLSKIVFGYEGGCPLELEEIGKKIGKSCKGLPLSIYVIGGCLAKSKHTREFWDYVEENLNSSIVNSEDDERCLKILHMSYKQLPVYLKPCFLYMGVFPEDKAIRVSKLIKLWVAEGFLKPVSGKNLEDTAKDYLKDLIDRNLVLIHEVGSTGNMKYCRIHDLLRDLSLREAEKERFYNVVRTHTSQGVTNTQRRIVIPSSTPKKEVENCLQSMSVARSLIWDLHEGVPSLSSRLLRILSTSRNRDAHSLETVLQLVNSRYLDFSFNARWWDLKCQFSSSVYQLWNLQTLIVEGLYGITAPIEIWDMPQIRHVQCSGLCLPDPPSGRNGIVLGNLQTLVTIENLKCGEEVVKRIPNIKKLRVCRSPGLTNLVGLHKLESFGFYDFPKGYWPDSLHGLDFPFSLKKLSLQIGFGHRWEVILGKIGALPLLEKLKLSSGYFEGSQWETREGQFCRLKYLEIQDCGNFEIWTTESSHFPCLEHLVLQRLRLREIPLEFAEIATLGLIELKFCRDSAAVSAKRIIEEQEELQGEVSLRVGVMVTGKNEALESLATPNFRVQCLEEFRLIFGRLMKHGEVDP